MNQFHLDSLLVGLYTLRVNPLRTLLSTLGVIIGVAALVAVLSLGDSLEAFSREQIEQSTDLQLVTLTPRTVDRVNGIIIPRKNVARLIADDVIDIQAHIEGLGRVTMTLTASGWVATDPDSSEHAMLLLATLPGALDLDDTAVVAGRFIEWTDFDAAMPVAVLSQSAANQLTSESDVSRLVGKQLVSGERVIGVLSPRKRKNSPTVVLPLDTRNRERLADADHVPVVLLRANEIEDVSEILSNVEEWVSSRDGSKEDDFIISSSSARVSQAAQGMMVFKLALGSIAGISLIVGGIGIMNILLASVTERTREIGIRRASGARRGHILIQFLSESVVISVVGSTIGALIGVGATYLITAVIEMITDAPLTAVFSGGSLLFAAFAAILIGLAFGTYPARLAARIEPAVAMRYE